MDDASPIDQLIKNFVKSAKRRSVELGLSKSPGSKKLRAKHKVERKRKKEGRKRR